MTSWTSSGTRPSNTQIKGDTAIVIQIVSQNYHPDNFIIHDIAAELVRQGHTVRVLTGLPDYSTSLVPSEYRRGKRRREVIDGVAVRRVPIVARRHGLFFRVLNYLSFMINSSLYALFCRNDADVLLVSQPSPIFQAAAAIVWKHKYNTKLVLYCLDLWPESLKAWNVKESSIIFRAVQVVSRWMYNECDTVAVTSTPFIAYLESVCNVPSGKLTYLPQHAADLYADIADDYEENGVTDFLFAGNIGSVQNIDCILHATALLSTDKPYRVHIVGDGSELAACKELAASLQLGDRVIFHGRHPQEAMHDFYRMADCFLLTLRGGDFIGMTLPGKAQGYLSAGRPIVAAIDGAGATMIAEADCGEVAPAGDSARLAEKMQLIIDNEPLYRQKGRNGRDFYTKHYTQEHFMRSLLNILERS